MEPVQAVGADLIRAILEGEVKRIVEKVRAGKRLSDWEMGLLFINVLSSKVDALDKGYSELVEEIKSVRGEIGSLRKDMDVKISEVRGEIGSLRKDMDVKFSELRRELREEIKSLKDYVEARIADVKSDTNYLKVSLGQLRDNVISLLVEELRRSRKEESGRAGP